MVRLRALGLSSAYRSGLRDGWSWVSRYMQDRGVRLSHISDPIRLDRLLERFVQSAYEDGERLYRVTLAVVAVQRRLRVSGALLKSTWSAVKGWKLMRPSLPRVPITRYLLEALVLAGFARGAHDVGLRRRRWFGAALGWWLAFDALLRPAEVLRLQCRDLPFP